MDEKPGQEGEHPDLDRGVLPHEPVADNTGQGKGPRLLLGEHGIHLVRQADECPGSPEGPTEHTPRAAITNEPTGAVLSSELRGRRLSTGSPPAGPQLELSARDLAQPCGAALPPFGGLDSLGGRARLWHAQTTFIEAGPATSPPWSGQWNSTRQKPTLSHPKEGGSRGDGARR